MDLASGHKLHKMTQKEKEERAKYFVGDNGQEYVRVTPGDWIFPVGYEIIVNTVYNLKVNIM